MKKHSVLDLIGNTPIVRVTHLTPNDNVEIYAELKKYNPGGSVKDRIAQYMIEHAEKYPSTELCDSTKCLDCVRKYNISYAYKDESVK